MTEAIRWLLFLSSVLFLPPLTVGVIRKTKARLQNRVGAPVFQPILNLLKLLQKGETISYTASWLFRAVCPVNMGIVILIAFLTPWVSYKPSVAGEDIFLVIYLLALVRFLTILASLDSASPFGAFASSREATIALLVEPAVILSLVSLAIPVRTSNLGQIFSFGSGSGGSDPALWLLAGTGLFLASLVELSRMPVDDPTTHLELTMVHEAMIIENSGKNLALVEYAHALRMALLYGLSGQCYLHAFCLFVPVTEWVRAGLSLALVLGLGVVTALIEGTAVKLQWRKVPEFIAYGLTMSLLATLVAIARGTVL